MVSRSTLIAGMVLLAVARAAFAVAPGYPLENPSIKGISTGYWHIERLGDRMWLVAPDGNSAFMRSVALFDSASSGPSGRSFRSYDKVLLVPSGSSNTDASAAAKDNSTPLLAAGQSHTLQNAGDALYIGSKRFQPRVHVLPDEHHRRGGHRRVGRVVVLFELGVEVRRFAALLEPA